MGGDVYFTLRFGFVNTTNTYAKLSDSLLSAFDQVIATFFSSYENSFFFYTIFIYQSK